MKLYFNNTELDIILDNDSYRYRAIQGDNSLTLKFSSVSHIDIPVGATCVFQGEEYTLTSDENLTMVNSENFEYTLIMDSQKYKLDKWKFKNTVDKRLKFNLTAKPIEHLQMLVDNLNQRDNGWQVGECVDSAEKYIGYNHAYCIDTLKQMASEFETEYYIDNKTIGLKKLELNKENPISLAYGKGNGFLGDIKREVQSDETPIEILYTQGGTRNIDFSTYRNSELLLPKNQTIKFDGEYFEGETEFNQTNSREYITDAEGLGIQRNEKALTTKSEDSLDLSNIYPQRVGTISDVLTYDDLYDIVDNSIPASLNFNDYQIAGEKMTIIFQSGMLAGKEFEVNYKHDAGDLAGRRFEIVNQEIDGETMPNSTFAPQIGDTYSVFHVALPQDYISNDTLKIGASWDMFKEGVKYLYEHENQQFSISGTLDKIWAKSDWENIGGKLVLGGYVLFSDRHFQDDDLLIRIVGIKDFINNPHAPEIELSNTPISTSVSTTLKKIDSNEEVTENLHKEALSFTKRRYRDSAETISLLENAMLTNYTASISPITIKAMQLMVGDESLQFRFVNSLTDLTQKNLDLTYLNGILDVSKSCIQHMTLGINTISPIHDNYLTWEVDAFTSPYLDEVDKAYYLYAKVSKVDNTGSFVLSEDPITMEQVSGYYHLLVGLLNSEYDGTRSFVPMYGFTEVLPGRITTDKIISTDGKTYFDLINGIIGGKITFTNSSGDEEFVSDLADNVNTFVDTTYPTDKSNIQTQLDGKIESWFQSVDPSYGWTNKSIHIGDMWYNTNTKKLKRYDSAFTWELIEDKTAIDAYANAANAQDTADGKRRVFTSTPYPPYDIGDLWAQGSGGDLYRCSTARQEGAIYLFADWELASKYTDDSSLNNFVDVTYSNDISNIQTQLDGKIESWFQSVDPSLNWNTSEKELHHGDMWYNTTSKELKRYNDSNVWELIEDQKAIDAYANAANAQDTADGKRRVFTEEPYPPYDEGDLWTDGVDLRRCENQRLSGSYVASDWGIATHYDNTTVTIDNGIVTAGSMQVGGADGFIKAGITGDGTSEDSVRFFAGDTFTNRNTAPFRVYQSGKTVQTDGVFSGRIDATSGSIGGFEIGDGHIGKTDGSQGLYFNSNAISLRKDGISTHISTGGYLIPAVILENHSVQSFTENTCMSISCKNSTKGNVALDVKAGQFRNFNMPIRVVTYNTTLTINDTYIVCNSTSNITITLPNLPIEQDGHVFYVKAYVNKYVIVEPATGCDILDANGGRGSDRLRGHGDCYMYVWCYELKCYMGGDMI